MYLVRSRTVALHVYAGFARMLASPANARPPLMRCHMRWPPTPHPSLPSGYLNCLLSLPPCFLGCSSQVLECGSFMPTQCPWPVAASTGLTSPSFLPSPAPTAYLLLTATYSHDWYGSWDGSCPPSPPLDRQKGDGGLPWPMVPTLMLHLMCMPGGTPPLRGRMRPLWLHHSQQPPRLTPRANLPMPANLFRGQRHQHHKLN